MEQQTLEARGIEQACASNRMRVLLRSETTLVAERAARLRRSRHRLVAYRDESGRGWICGYGVTRRRLGRPRQIVMRSQACHTALPEFAAWLTACRSPRRSPPRS